MIAEHPRLCIVIPTKDRPNLLREAVQSALYSSTNDVVDVIVVDDNGEIPAAHSLADFSDERLKIIVNRGPNGPAAARNYGVNHTDANTILFLDDDDLLVPGYADWICEFRKAHMDVGYGSSSILRFDAEPKRVDLYQTTRTSHISSLPFNKRMVGLGCGFWIDKELFLNVGGVSEDLLVNEDTEFCIKLMAFGAIGCRFYKPGVQIRTHSVQHDLGSITKRTKAATRAQNFEKILTKHQSWFQQNSEAKFYILKRLLKMYAKARNWTDARSVLRDHGNPSLYAAFLFNFLGNLVR